MNITDKKNIKCAIYTRKSSESGLEQDFNSLDAQREACESYIKSQRNEGWVLVEKQYNDGGFSGGSLERPALKELLVDIEAGEIDTVVVYKIDRLTRSLMDFAKIVELFDKHLASFVSITQHFNTTTSMGRLTLNVLLSFAQFEREVTGERIRDKIAASKKKGMWMSGMAPIGYELKDKKLSIDNVNAKKVRIIFAKYLELKSVPGLKRYLDENNIKTKSKRTFVKGHLYRLLANKTYAGLIQHKANVYKGEQEAIIDEKIFRQVQTLLSQNRITEKCSMHSKIPSLLAGKLFDDNGNCMSPSHSNTRNRRYRYYISQAILQSRKNEAGNISKIPAGEIETLIKHEIKDFLLNTQNIQQYIEDYDIHKQKDLLLTLNRLQTELKDKIDSVCIRTILSKVVLYNEKVDIILCKEQLIKVLEAITYDTQFPEELKGESESPIFVTKKIRISSTSSNNGILIISNSQKQETSINHHLVRAIVKSYYWNNLLISGEVESIKKIQKMENLNTDRYIKKILNLKYLAPTIFEAILNGTQPRDLNVQKLCEIKTSDWEEQKQILNF